MPTVDLLRTFGAFVEVVVAAVAAVALIDAAIEFVGIVAVIRVGEM